MSSRCRLFDHAAADVSNPYTSVDHNLMNVIGDLLANLEIASDLSGGLSARKRIFCDSELNRAHLSGRLLFHL